jgi:hypothetical protein
MKITGLVAFLLLSTAASHASTISTAHFTVSADGFSENYARRVADSAEKSLVRIKEGLGHTPDGTVSIMLADTDARFRELTRETLPDWSAAVALPGRRIIVSPLAGQKIDIDRIIAHEIVHVVIDEAAGEKFVPRWFHEGCAQTWSGEWGIRNELYVSWMVMQKRELTFSDIQDVFSRGDLDAGLAYDQSMLAVHQLVSVSGDKVVSRIIGGLSGGSEFQEAFLNATGFSVDEFERNFLIFLHDSYGIRLFIALIPGTWTLMMVLFLVVYIVKRRRMKRKLAEWAAAGAAPKTTVAPDDESIPEEIEGDEEDGDEMFSDEDEPEEKRGTILKFRPRPDKYGGDDEHR